MLRIQSPHCRIVLGDFNETGFEAMQEVHGVIYGDSHSLGSLKIADAEVILKRAYSDLEMVVTPLNITYIASRKK
ncbi:MAG: hypothetical protein NTZ35_18475 [Ignavibacteriales bacterium]|nr:hypothetical protein [Ignavibacteriales bacterium]